jgi:hypothetical protein
VLAFDFFFDGKKSGVFIFIYKVAIMPSETGNSEAARQPG